MDAELTLLLSEWQCEVCTLINTQDTCLACFAKRPNQLHPAKVPKVDKKFGLLVFVFLFLNLSSFFPGN
jgi:hypothetical protein